MTDNIHRSMVLLSWGVIVTGLAVFAVGIWAAWKGESGMGAAVGGIGGVISGMGILMLLEETGKTP